MCLAGSLAFTFEKHSFAPSPSFRRVNDTFNILTFSARYSGHFIAPPSSPSLNYFNSRLIWRRQQAEEILIRRCRLLSCSQDTIRRYSVFRGTEWSVTETTACTICKSEMWVWKTTLSTSAKSDPTGRRVWRQLTRFDRRPTWRLCVSIPFNFILITYTRL